MNSRDDIMRKLGLTEDDFKSKDKKAEKLIELEKTTESLKAENQAMSDMIDTLLTEVLPMMLGE